MAVFRICSEGPSFASVVHQLWHGAFPNKVISYLQVFDKSLEKGNEMFCSSDISWYSFLKQVIR